MRLVSDWPGERARLLTSESLAQRGWVWKPWSIDTSFVVIEGDQIPVGSIRAVLSLTPVIDPGELAEIVSEDRHYVAGEMTAFLVAWLTWLADQGVAVMNRPTPLSLTGPALHQEQWLMAAAREGLTIQPSHRRTGIFEAADPDEPGVRFDATRSSVAETVLAIPLVRDQVLPDPAGRRLPERVARRLHRLATAVRADMLTGLFVESGGELRFSNAVPAVDIGRPEVAAAVVDAIGVSA
jgi:hypothetical protein